MEGNDSQKKTNDTDKVFVTHNFSIKEAEEEIFWVKYSHDGNELAFASADGAVRILDLETLEIRELVAHAKANKFDQMPITWLRWRDAKSSK